MAKEPLRIAVIGALGKMGSELIRAASKDKEVIIVIAIDHKNYGKDVGVLCGVEPLGVLIEEDLGAALDRVKADVGVVLTGPEGAVPSITALVTHKVAAVVGSTGFYDSIPALEVLSAKHETPVFIVPNFAVGAVLMMQFAQKAAKYFNNAEVIEMHHDKKADAPSGTAHKTLELMAAAKAETGKEFIDVSTSKFSVEGARGGVMDNIRVHSIRMPGFVAHQQVLFGSEGETLTIRHDSIHRSSFMPGILLSCKKVWGLKGVVSGLENVL